MKVGKPIYPPFNKIERNITCVYKINFICGFYYIGSTYCLYSRLYAHKSLHNASFKTYQYQKILTWKDVVSVEILSLGEIGEMRAAEKKFIGESCNNHPCLNIIRQMGGKIIVEDNLQPIQ